MSRKARKFKGFFLPKIRCSPKKKKKKRSSPKFRVIFRPKSEIQRFFFPKSGVLKKKKKKKKRSSPKFRVIFRPKSEIQRFFLPKIRCSPKKKKKRSSLKFRVIFRPKSEIQRFFLPKIRCSPKKKLGVLQKKKKKVFTQGPSRFKPGLTQISSREPDAQFTKGGAMPQFCSLYYAILQS